MSRHFHTTLVAVAALCLTGCCSLARLACGIEAPPSPPRGNRDTPDAAVDFLIDAFRNRRIDDIYKSFHPSFTAENGSFSQSDFSVAYDHYEADFAADAETMAAAQRKVPPATGNVVEVELTDATTGAYLVLTFENQPRIRIATKNPFARSIEGPVDMHALVKLESGRLTLPQNFALTSIENLSPELAAALKSADILRVEISDDWLVRGIDPARSKNIRFVDKIKEHLPQ